MKEIYIVLLFFLSLIVHELGHYLAYKDAGRKPFFIYHWWGIYADCENRITLTLKQYFSIGLIGILSGLCVILFTNNSYSIFLYLLACSIDFAIIFQLLEIPFKEWKTLTIFQLEEREYLKHKKEMRNI